MNGNYLLHVVTQNWHQEAEEMLCASSSNNKHQRVPYNYVALWRATGTSAIKEGKTTVCSLEL